MKEFTYNVCGVTFENARLYAGRYNASGLYLGLYNDEDGDIDDITVNLGYPEKDGCIYIDQNFSDDKVRFIEENNLGTKIDEKSIGFATFPIVQLNMGNLRDAVSEKDGREYIF